MPLSTAERLDLMNDPRLKTLDPAGWTALYQQLEPSDRAWMDQAFERNKPATLPQMMKQGAERLGGYAKEHPAEAGAIVGGAAMTPFTGGASLPAALAAAGVGGFTGASLGMLTSAGLDPNSPVPRTTTGVLTEAGKQGAIQAAGEGVGQAIGAGLRGGGNQLMDAAIGSQARIRGEFPDVNLPAVLNRNAINPTTKRGAARAGVLRRSSAEETQRIADEAGSRGVTITRGDVAPAMKASERMAAEDAGAGTLGGQSRIAAEVDRVFDAQFPYGDIPANKAPAVTRSVQRRGKAARNAANAGDLPKTVDAAASDDLASGIRQAANQKIGPEYAQSNAKTQGLIAAGKVARRVSREPVSLPSLKASGFGGAVGGAGWLAGDPVTGMLAGAVPMALSVPQISAPAAIAMYQAGRLPYALALKLVGPVALRSAGITPPK